MRQQNLSEMQGRTFSWDVSLVVAPVRIQRDNRHRDWQFVKRIAERLPKSRLATSVSSSPPSGSSSLWNSRDAVRFHGTQYTQLPRFLVEGISRSDRFYPAAFLLFHIKIRKTWVESSSQERCMAGLLPNTKFAKLSGQVLCTRMVACLRLFFARFMFSNALILSPPDPRYSTNLCHQPRRYALTHGSGTTLQNSV